MSRFPQKTAVDPGRTRRVDLAFQVLSIPWIQWREHSVYQSLRSGLGPEFWWPPGWRRELRTSILLEGEAKLRAHELERSRTGGSSARRSSRAACCSRRDRAGPRQLRSRVPGNRGQREVLVSTTAIARRSVQGTPYDSGWSRDRMAASRAARFRSSPDQLVVLENTRLGLVRQAHGVSSLGPCYFALIGATS